jgi:hypothetical protein
VGKRERAEKGEERRILGPLFWEKKAPARILISLLSLLPLPLPPQAGVEAVADTFAEHVVAHDCNEDCQSGVD